jgi:hypothetical protein
MFVRPHTRESASFPTIARRAARSAALLWAALVFFPVSAAALPLTNLIISEVFVNPNGFWGDDDDGFEWVEIYNGTGGPISLNNYTLGWGGADYTVGTLNLTGSIANGQFFVIGGPASDMTGPPDFNPDLGNGDWWVADGVALFDTTISPTTPIDSILYSWPGGGNSNGLIDETGNPGVVEVQTWASNVSFEYDGLSWAIQNNPTPGAGTLNTPEPNPGVALLFGLAFLSGWRSRVRRLRHNTVLPAG